MTTQTDYDHDIARLADRMAVVFANRSNRYLADNHAQASVWIDLARYATKRAVDALERETIDRE
ncbi:MAG: hypothetical protein LBI33_14350 [Propionibacteriaceae bacterium]|nr:hypothetical protein [Propionibacteriaceae bacterium]